ncbi:hypothetical protein ACWDZ4_13960 [Streptomyces sp. NPDC003016]
MILEASAQAAGSWPQHYDSLTLFSPAAHSPLPRLPFGGNPDRYPHRDEVVACLLRYAEQWDADTRTGQRASSAHTDGGAPRSSLLTGESSGRERRHGHRRLRPAEPTSPPGFDTFAGAVLHVSEYRTPEPYSGQRVVVVGAGNPPYR